MKNLDDVVDAIALGIGLNQDEIEQRKTFLEITDTDIALLEQVHQQLSREYDVFADVFYNHLRAFPSLSHLLSDAPTATRLRHAHALYFSQLTEGTYDQDYFRHRVRVGIVHQRIGLEPKWYIGAYRKYLSEMALALQQLFAHEPVKFLSAFNALLKIVFLDIGLALDTYFHIDHQSIFQHKNFAEQVIASMPSGVLVIDAQCNVRSINSAMRQICNVGASEHVLGQPLSIIIGSPDLSERITQLSNNAIQLAVEHTFVVALLGVTELRHIEFNVSDTFLEGEHLWLLIAQDVTQRVRAEEKWRHFRIGMDNSTDAIHVIDRARMRIIDVNEAACQMLGYTREEMLQMAPQEIRIDVSMAKLASDYDHTIQSNDKVNVRKAELRRKDGSRLPVEIQRTALQSEGRDILVAVTHDITERLAAQAALDASEARFLATFNQAAVGLAHATTDGRWLRCNRKLSQIIGYSEEELLNMTVQEMIHPDDLSTTLELIRRTLTGELSDYSSQKRYPHKDGGYIWVSVCVSLARGMGGAPDYFIVGIEDISAQKRMEEDLIHLAHHDALTNLPNRTLLHDRLSQAIVYANRSGRHVAAMLIDLDRFKNINDSLGHDAGDRVIVETGRRLCCNTRDGDTVARLGGDEFVVILADVAREEDVAVLAQQILEGMMEPMLVSGEKLYLSGSIGISLFPKDGRDGQNLLQNADTAMYQSKACGGNTFQFYAQEMNALTLERLKLEARLRQALEQHEFVLHYQPQVDIASGVIVGVEALIRWQPPGQALVPPNDFIPIAEETGLIVQIGEWVLRTACAQQSAWRRAGSPVIRMAVNLSARQFRQNDIVKMVSQVLHETDCSAASLELEITESVIMENVEAATETLRELSEMGVHLSIDDFGTGYSSLSYLKRFPIHTLKIDRSFIMDISDHKDDAAIAKAIILLAHSMNLRVIAEGVETKKQLDFLEEHGCNQMQGYLFSPPLPAEQIEALFNKGDSATSWSTRRKTSF